METIASRLARYVRDIRYEDLPSEVVRKAKQCILDQLGVQLRGATLPAVQPVYRLVQGMGGKQESTVVYHGARTTASYAGYVNATFGHSCEFDDILWGAGHPGAATVPTAFALSERLDATGKDLITSVVVGYEVMPRAAGPIFTRMVERGWHHMSVVGVFGAAATAAKLLGLEKREVEHAFAIAGSHASGTMEYDQSGGEVKRLHAGLAVRSGIQAALLAREGLTGPLTIIEGKRGILRVFGGGDVKELDEYWRKDFHILSTLFKLYPAVGNVHGPLDVLRDLTREHQFTGEDVEEINVWLADIAVAHCGSIYRPEDALGAQFSLPYSVALYLVEGSNSLSLYLDSRLWRDQRILAMADRVKTHGVHVAEGDNHLAARVEIRLKDGRRIEGYRDFFRGHPRNPASPEELEGKFSSLVSEALSPGQAERLKQEIGRLEELDDLSHLWALLVHQG